MTSSRKSVNARVVLSLVLCALLTFEMFCDLTGDLLHELVSIAFAVLLAVVVLALTSVLISELLEEAGVSSFMPGFDRFALRIIHTISAYVLCAAVVVHVALHCLAVVKVLHIPYDPARRKALDTAVTAVATIGVVALGVSCYSDVSQRGRGAGESKGQGSGNGRSRKATVQVDFVLQESLNCAYRTFARSYVRHYTYIVSAYRNEVTMTASSVTIRVDSDIKDGASRIAEYFGFDLSSVTRAFYLQMIRENRIPLNLSVLEPNEESLKSIQEAEEILAGGGTGKSYSSGRELIEAALKD